MRRRRRSEPNPDDGLSSELTKWRERLQEGIDVEGIVAAVARKYDRLRISPRQSRTQVLGHIRGKPTLDVRECGAEVRTGWIGRERAMEVNQSVCSGCGTRYRAFDAVVKIRRDLMPACVEVLSEEGVQIVRRRMPQVAQRVRERVQTKNSIYDIQDSFQSREVARNAHRAVVITHARQAEGLEELS